MRDFLYSDISQMYGISNIPHHADVAIDVGKNLCQNVLEPIQQQFGRISIRAAYRDPEVNAKGERIRTNIIVLATSQIMLIISGTILINMENLVLLFV